MSDFKNILVVIDPGENTHHGLRRAIRMNEKFENVANIHLFISIEKEKLSQNDSLSENFIDHKRLVELVKPLEDDNINYTSEIHWTNDWHKSIMVASARHEIDLVIMSDYTNREDHIDLSTSEWSLLRSSKCPILIVHPGAKAERKIILAAVNMKTDDPHHTKLNSKVLDIAGALAKNHGAEKHIINAYEDGTEFPDRAGLIRSTNAKQENIHVKQGNPTDIISEVATNIKADIVVIGNIAQKGMLAAMRGNKSEEVIRELGCDVMVLN